MSTSTWTDNDTAKAMEIWNEYQKNNDVEDMRGQVAGIDPISERVWIAPSAIETAEAMEADGVNHLLFFIRVGYDYHVRKGGRAR